MFSVKTSEGKRYVNSWCRACAAEYNKERYAADPEFYRSRSRARYLKDPEKMRKYTKTSLIRVREDIFRHYGSVCKCCGEKDRRFLTLDHINDDGAEQRKRRGGVSWYFTIRKAGYPDDLQVLCWNCNCGKHIYKVCPHKLKEKEDGGKTVGP